MRTFIFCVLLSCISLVSSLSWNYAPNGTECIVVSWDISKMQLMGTDSDGEGRMASIAVTTGVVDTNTSSCNEALRTLTVDFEKDVKLTLTFTPQNDQVTMDGTLTIVPGVVLGQGFDNSTKVLDLNGSVPLSSVNNSFACVSLMSIKFTSATANDTFTLDLDAANTTIQAFGIKDGNFSPATPCAADSGNSTEAPTSEAPTTEAPTTGNMTTEAPTTGNMTTEAPTTGNMTTEAPTTGNMTEAPTTAPQTTAPPPKAATYYFPNNTHPCIIVRGIFTVGVSYAKKDNTTGTVKLEIPAAAKTGGSCPENNTNSEMSLTWGTGEATRTLRMAFSATADKAMIATLDIDIDMDTTTFPDAKDQKITEEGAVNISLSHPTGYYTCTAPQAETVGAETNLTMSEVAIQAFNVNGSDFSGNAEHCAADNVPTTETPVTTPAPVTPKPGAPPTNNYTFGNHCIVLDAAMEFSIPYTNKDGKNVTQMVGIPKNFTVSGECGNVTQTLKVEFYDDWKMEMNFELSSPGSDTFYLHDMFLTYSLQPEIFPDPKTPHDKFMVNNTFSSTQFSAKKTGSYQCSSKVTLGLNHGVSMNAYNVKVKAFSTENSAKFTSTDLSECPQDSETNSVVPIAVGAALAGLVIIVLIAYLIGRRRSRGGYEQV